MAGDDLEARVARSEVDIARAHQRLDDLTRTVGTVTPLIPLAATMAEQIRSIGENQAEFIKETREERKEWRDERDTAREEARKERRQTLFWYGTSTVAIICALIGAFGLILSAGGLH